ncbi:MAG: hypothetical protein R2787_11115 [Saprospiraceae bacterium]
MRLTPSSILFLGILFQSLTLSCTSKIKSVDDQLFLDVILKYFPCDSADFVMSISRTIHPISESHFKEIKASLPGETEYSPELAKDIFRIDSVELVKKSECYRNVSFNELSSEESKSLNQHGGVPVIYFVASFFYLNDSTKAYILIERKVLKNYSAVGALYLKGDDGQWYFDKEIYHAAS